MRLHFKRVVTYRFMLIALALVAVAVLLHPLWLNVGYFRRTLDPQLVPTAEYLLSNPLPTPSFVLAVQPPTGASIDRTQEICVSLLPGGSNGNADELRNAALGTRIAINEQIIPVEAVRMRMIYTMPGFLIACFHADVEPGIHLFAVEMRTSPVGMLGFGEVFSYAWSYRVK
ncbi:MAG: hypothetical protein JNM70_18790 [Anaerolineae bacterium]|nr:hypothetical protein [Anaerolineae bacterium]